MPLLWREEMAVGQADIDGDHRQLIAIINDFTKMAERLPGNRVLHETLLGLHDYTAMHFQREEAIQIACHFPRHEAHKREHQELLTEVETMARGYFILKSREVTKESLSETATFLRHWLVDHIIKSDLLMRDHLHKLPPGFKLPD